MKKVQVVFIFIITLASLIQTVNANASDNIARAIITSQVENREPVDDLTVIKAGELDKVYLFTEVINQANTMITHRWFHNGRLEAEVVLKIGSDRWRTYSSKNLVYPNHEGQWQVEVVDQKNQPLGSAQFSIEP